MVQVNIKFDNIREAETFIRLLEVQEAMLEDYEQGFISVDVCNLVSLLNDVRWQINGRIEEISKDE